MKACNELGEGICNSVPFHLCNNVFTAEALPDLDDEATARNNPSKPISGMALIWILFTGSQFVLLPLTQRLWMRGKLRWIGENLGFGQATVMADVDITEEEFWAECFSHDSDVKSFGDSSSV